MIMELWIPLLVAIAAWIPHVLTWLGSRKLTDAQVVNTIMEGGSKGVAAAINLLNEYQESNLALRVEVADLKSKIEKIQAARQKRDLETKKDRDELKARIQSDLMETEALRRQVVKLEDMAIKTGEYVDRILVKAKEQGWDIPLNGELMESVRRLKLSVEERRKLAGGR